MRYIFSIILVVLINGCVKEPYRDTYVAAIKDYMAKLDSADYNEDNKLEPPPKPSYLRCPTEPEPLPGHGHSGSESSHLSSSESVSPRRLLTGSTVQCGQINKTRKEAYEIALGKYHSFASDANK